MTNVHATSTYNVEASINKYFKDALTALTRPAALFTAMPALVENMPEAVASLPAFSFEHLPAGSLDIYQGRNAEANTRAARELGILDLSAWVSRKNGQFVGQLRFMQAMIVTAYLDSRGGVVIKDYASNVSNPSAVAFRVTFVDLDVVSVSDDPNPDVRRRRCLVKYQWDMRSTN